MRETLEDLDDWQQQGEQIALATLVDTHGPSPRPAGARFAVTRSGRMAGSVSGGCVEADVFETAMKVLDSGRPLIRSYSISDETSVAVGLSCGGDIDVLIEPWTEDEAWRTVRLAVAEEHPAALCVALGPETLIGRRLAVMGGNETHGTIAPELDAAIVEDARSMLKDGGHRVITLSWSGAESRIFVEAFPPRQRLFIVGATHTAIPLCRMACLLGYHVSVIDPRAPFATRERFPEADALLLEWPDEVFERVGLDERCSVLSLIHDLKFDVPTLARALRSPARYVGALGSRRTHERRKQALRERGFDDAELARIHTPIGLDLGARSPEEIALSILAEIVAVRHGRDAAPLVGREKPIHAGGE